MTDPTTVALAGGTGVLGRLIADELLALPDVRLRLLVRPGSRSKSAALEVRGAEVIEGDLSGSDDALAMLCDGAGVVISAVAGGPAELVEGQGRLLQAARHAGVRRLLPSDFSINLFGLPEGANLNSDWRRAFARDAEHDRGDVDVVHVLNGCFLDRQVLFGFLGLIDLRRGQAHLWGEGHQPMDFTTYADTAWFTARAALDPEPVPSHFAVAGDVLDFHGLVGAYQDGSGKHLSIKQHGSLQDLDARIDHLLAADPDNLFAYLPLMYVRAMLNGDGKLRALTNDRYPDRHPTTVEQYVAEQNL